MIGKRGDSHARFDNLISYQLRIDKCSEFQTYNLFADDPKGIADEMMKTFRAANNGRSKNERIEKPTYHIIFSWPVEDQPTPEQMMAVGDDFLKYMELDEYQAVVGIHNDTKQQHIHIAANRVHPTGGPTWEEWKWDDSPEGRKLTANHHQRVETFARTMEKEFGWKIVPGRHAGDPGKKFDGRAPNLWEIRKESDKKEKATETGYEVEAGDFRTPRLKADDLKEHLFKAKTFGEFDDILAKKDLWLEKKGQGVVITDGFDSVPGSHVSRAFSKGKLEEKFDQDFEDYSKKRENYISRSDGDRMVTKALAIQLIMDLDQRRDITKRELREIEIIIEDFDQNPEIENIRKEITSSFEKAYNNSGLAYDRFLLYAEQFGSYQAYEQISEEPEYFGDIKNEHAFFGLSEHLRNFESKSTEANAYIDSLLKSNQKKRLTEKKDDLRRSYKDLTGELATLKRQANKAMAKVLAETEEGRDLLKLNRKIRKSVKLVHKIISLHRSLMRISKGSSAPFPKKMMKSIGIQGSAIALNSVKTCSQALLRAGEINRNQDISR